MAINNTLGFEFTLIFDTDTKTQSYWYPALALTRVHSRFAVARSRWIYAQVQKYGGSEGSGTARCCLARCSRESARCTLSHVARAAAIYFIPAAE